MPIFDKINNTNIKSNIIDEVKIQKNKQNVDFQQNKIQDVTEIDKNKELKQIDIQKLIKKLNEYPLLNNFLTFSYVKEAEMLVVKVKDKETEEVIRQFPSEEFLKKLKASKENISLLLDNKV